VPSQTGMRLRAIRHQVWAEAHKLAQTAARENRTFDQGEQLLWIKLIQELDVLDYRLKAVLEAEKRSRDPQERVNPDYPWRAKVNYARRDPPRRLPAGCWQLMAG
jgi:hypothetical protein